MASEIGNSLDKVDPTILEYTIHKIAHAAASCAAAAATKQSCEAGAIGAGIGEIVASLMPPQSGLLYTDEEKQRVLVTGKLTAGIIAAYAGYDVNTAANSADIALINNSFDEKKVKKVLDQAKSYLGEKGSAALDAVSRGIAKGDIESLKNIQTNIAEYLLKKADSGGLSQEETVVWGTLYALNTAIFPTNILDVLPGVGKGVNKGNDLLRIVRVEGKEISATKTIGTPACFTAGTLIETSEGLKAVETFVGGELVWSRHEKTHEYGYRPVISTKRTENQAIFKVVIENLLGQQETLETTVEHPFWVKDYGWLKASLLESGMTLLDRNNNELKVVSQHLIPDYLDTVYNIEIDEYHTYHVGELGTWVHNADCNIAEEFEKRLFKLPTNERIAVIKSESRIAAENLGFVKNNKLTKMNNRDVYVAKDGYYYALDTQHGAWEKINPKNGAHLGEVSLHTLTEVPRSIDKKGNHDILVK